LLLHIFENFRAINLFFELLTVITNKDMFLIYLTTNLYKFFKTITGSNLSWSWGCWGSDLGSGGCSGESNWTNFAQEGRRITT